MSLALHQEIAQQGSKTLLNQARARKDETWSWSDKQYTVTYPYFAEQPSLLHMVAGPRLSLFWAFRYLATDFTSLHFPNYHLAAQSSSPAVDHGRLPPWCVSQAVRSKPSAPWFLISTIELSFIRDVPEALTLGRC